MINIKKRSFFWQLFLGLLLIMLITNIVIYLYMVSLIKTYVYRAESQNIEREALAIKANIENNNYQNNSLDKQEKFIKTLSKTLNYKIWLIDHSGNIVYDTNNTTANTSPMIIESFNKKSNGSTTLSITKDSKGESFLTVATPIKLPGHNNIDVLAIHTPISGINYAVRDVEKQLLLGIILVLIASILVSFYFTKKLTLPIKRLIKATEEISKGNYKKLLFNNTNNELYDLSLSFNNMTEKLSHIDKEKRKLDKLKRDFLSDLSHELQTPLTTLEAFLEALKDGMVVSEEKKRKYILALYDETMHLKRLASDLLQLARIESGQLLVVRTSFNPTELARNIIDNLSPLAISKGNMLVFNYDPNCPDIWCDRDHFKQMLTNLIKNAIQFSTDSQIFINIEIENYYLRVSVKDNGIGINPAQIPFIWNRFYKVDKVRSKQHHETGLGLSIVKHLVELHKGKVGVESIPGKGSIFYFNLPLTCEITTVSHKIDR